MMYKQTQTNKQILYLSRVKYKMAFNKNKTQKKKSYWSYQLLHFQL